MRFGMRKQSIKRSLKGRTTGKIKRKEKQRKKNIFVNISSFGMNSIL